jgi:hypothetical protein
MISLCPFELGVMGTGSGGQKRAILAVNHETLYDGRIMVNKALP